MKNKLNQKRVLKKINVFLEQVKKYIFFKISRQIEKDDLLMNSLINKESNRLKSFGAKQLNVKVSLCGDDFVRDITTVKITFNHSKIDNRL